MMRSKCLVFPFNEKIATIAAGEMNSGNDWEAKKKEIKAVYISRLQSSRPFQEVFQVVWKTRRTKQSSYLER